MAQFDERTEQNLATLLPAAQELARRFLVAAKSVLPADVTIKVISGSRTYAEQDALYAQGRSKPGDIVTKARGGESNHNFKVAFDVGLFRGTKYLTNDPLYEKLGPVGESVGLEWGGRWATIDDEPHYQLRTGLSIKEMDRRTRAGISVLQGTIYEKGVPATVKPVQPAEPRPMTLVVVGSSLPPYEVSAGASDEVRATAERMGGTVTYDPNLRRIIVTQKAGKG